MRGQVHEAAQALSKRRKTAARKLDKAVSAAMQSLGMKGAAFSTQFEPIEHGAHGAERIEFMLTANAGEALKPLRQVASGGEISRIMLALKAVFARADAIPTLIFDEIDAGVGGAVAGKVAEKLGKLAGSHQVICITHLAQIAPWPPRITMSKRKPRSAAPQPRSAPWTAMRAWTKLRGCSMAPRPKSAGNMRAHCWRVRNTGRKQNMRITSYGGAGEVTGSKHLLEINGNRILLDCGLFQGRREDSDRKNRDLGFDASKVNAVLLSHAHIDHSGLLPMLVKRGFRGVVYATHATRDLCSIMLLDSAHIQQRDAEWLSKKQMAYVAPLYGKEDVQGDHAQLRRDVVRQAHPRRQRRLRHLPRRGPRARLGHDRTRILRGRRAPQAYLQRRHRPQEYAHPQRPVEPGAADTVMMESTYGNREHDPIEEADEKLAAIINETRARGGKVVIPTFALERAQEIIYALKSLEASGAIPSIPVFVDSPLTVNITEIFRLHTEGFDREFAELMRDAGDPFQLENIRYIRDRNQSMELNNLEGPAIILSASGMCEFGRIVHHLRNTISDPRNTVLIVGFQAEHTLGRRIVEKRRTVKIFGVAREHQRAGQSHERIQRARRDAPNCSTSARSSPPRQRSFWYTAKNRPWPR